MKKVLKHLALFLIFGALYIVIELVYRGYSHWTMFVLGGVCGICVGLINEFIPWNMPLWAQASIGTIVITSLEFICGVIINLWLQWNVWDYSNIPFNICGQVCLPFILIWFGISHIAIVFDDYIRYWFFNELKPNYRIF